MRVATGECREPTKARQLSAGLALLHLLGSSANLHTPPSRVDDTMKTYAVPDSDLAVPSVVLGLMRIASMSDADIRRLVGTALDAGITFFDHADVYGGTAHLCEERFGEAMRLSPDQRAHIVIQSKAGIRRGFFDFSTEHILRTVDESLAALKTEYLDVLLLHRPDALVEPDEVAAAFDTLETAGKVRYFGVSNQSPARSNCSKPRSSSPFDSIRCSSASRTQT